MSWTRRPESLRMNCGNYRPILLEMLALPNAHVRNPRKHVETSNTYCVDSVKVFIFSSKSNMKSQLSPESRANTELLLRNLRQRYKTHPYALKIAS
jgi:hypothetical protein